MRTLIAASISIALLFGCAAGGGQRSEIAVYDLAPTVSAGLNAPPNLIGRIEVTAPSWLATTAMQYRLAAEPGRRREFAQSRWAAPPAELLENSLRRHLAASGGCRVRLELEEWVQTFDSAGDSQAHVAARAVLTARRGMEPLAARQFELAHNAGHNANAGAVAFAKLGQQLSEAVATWVAEQDGKNPKLSGICAQ